MHEGLNEYHADHFGEATRMMTAHRVDVVNFLDLDEFCGDNAHLASEGTLQRKRQIQRRLSWVQAVWEDSSRFEAIVRSGRYLRLRHLIESLSDADARAWRRLKNEVLAIRAREFLCEDPVLN